MARSGQELPPDLPNYIIPVSDGLTILGIPVGTLDYKRKWCHEALGEIQRILGQIDKRQSYQSRLLLLRFVVSNNITHIARSVSPCAFAPTASAFKELVNTSLLKILTHCNTFDSSFPASDPQGSQMNMALHCGGMGIADIQLNCQFIYLAAFREHSFSLSKLVGKCYSTILRLNIPEVIDLRQALADLTTIAPNTVACSNPLEHIPDLPYPMHLQHLYTAVTEGARCKQLDSTFKQAVLNISTDPLENEENTRQLVRRIAVQQPGAMSFMNIAPLLRIHRADNHINAIMLRRVL